MTMPSSLTEPKQQQDILRISAEERVILDRQLHGLPLQDNRNKPSIYQYASITDKIVLAAGAVSALIAGALNPLVPVGHVYRQLDCWCIY